MAARSMTDKNSDSKKSKIALKISGYGNLEQGKPTTFATVGTQALTLFLWIISVPQLEIQYNLIRSPIISLHTSENARFFFECERMNFLNFSKFQKFFDIIKNNLS